MKKIYLAIALHFHQPKGNFEHIFERACQFCYKPFFEILWEYSELKITIHISGCLLDYLDEKHPELIKLIKQMVSRHQIEIMGGGYYEPILTAIPKRDLLGQIGMMSDYIKHEFGFIPKGMWIPERVWHPNLTKLIYKAGMRYLILDDEHLFRSGIKPGYIHGYFMTGSGREKLAVFPSDMKLRYLIPFKLPQETINYFKSFAAKKGNILFTYGDDGEKFGEWPGTHKWVHEEEWLRKFFDILQENKNWIELVHLSDYLRNNKPETALTIKQGSYRELMEWSGGCWLNFLSKYPEANQMHKKMMYVSSKIERMEKQAKPKETKKVERARRELCQGQCNCAYWHGVFGGLYLYHLRQAIYTHLIEAEKIADRLLHRNKDKWLDILELDYDLDSKDEFIMENRNFSIYVDPYEGGIIKELDYRPFSFNLVNTLSRKKESYHQKILQATQQVKDSKVATIHDDFRAVDSSLKKELVYDRFSRYFLRCYFVKKDLKLEDFLISSYEELGNFSTASYSAKVKDKSIVLQHNSTVSNARVNLSKGIRVKAQDEIEFFFSVKKKDSHKLEALLGCEFNLTLPDLDASRYSYYADGKSKKGLNLQGQSYPLSTFGILDSLKEFDICFSFSKRPACVWYFPVKTISQSERAYELNYQCSCIFFLWGLDFREKAKSCFNMNLVFKTSANKGYQYPRDKHA